MSFNHLSAYNIILASQSPRRKELFENLNVPFSVELKEDVAENYPDGLSNAEIAVFLAELKGKPFYNDVQTSNKLVVTSDTIVCIGDEVLGKPKDATDATEMLNKLSGVAHQVITGVSILSGTKKVSFYSITDVFFKTLSASEIEYYISTYKPFDKAGAYGIQEWIGMVGVERIEGSYFNVMGLPVHQLYEALLQF